MSELEDRSWRNNLRFDGIPEEKNETWEDCERKVENLLKNKLGIEGIKIERAHRTKGKKKDNSKPKTIVCKLHSYKDKARILGSSKKLKDTDYFINEDFSKETLEYRKELWKEVKSLREEGKIAYLNYKKVVIRDG